MPTILVIEDDPMIRDSIQDILEDEQYTVVAVGNGQHGLELLTETTPHLILCDIEMPDVTGHHVLNEVRKKSDTLTLPFIFLTGKSDRADIRQGMQLGADDYLTKPFTANELCTAVATQLQKQQIREELTASELNTLRSSITHALPDTLMKPLTSVVDMTELLVMDGKEIVNSPNSSEFLQDLHRSSKQIKCLTENLLLYLQIELILSHPERRKMIQDDNHQSRVLLKIKQVVEAKSKQYQRESDIILHVEDESLRIAADDFSKIFEEVLDNALRYSESGTLVEIEGQSFDNIFYLFVSDHGRGMTSDQLKNLALNPSQNNISRSFEGGLGLAITQRMLELYNGKISIESVPYLATVVRLEFPIVTLESEANL